MKYIVVLADGMVDYPVPDLGGKTPLQAARTPNMDGIQHLSRLGVVKTVPEELHPGSDVAIMSVLGYDPVANKNGRAPYEALSMGLDLKPNEIAFRCNLVTVGNDDLMLDYSGGHLSNAHAKELIAELNDFFADYPVKFYPGVGYRHIAVFDDPNFILDSAHCTPPHDISDKLITDYLPDSELLKDIVLKSYSLLIKNRTNLMKSVTGGSPANMAWLWGQGRKMALPSFEQVFGVKGGVISGVDLIRGLGIALGLQNIVVPGATGYFDTDYSAKARAALDFLKDNDFVFIHVEAPDEAGHEGNVKEKIRAIENIDDLILGPVLKALEGEDFRLLLMPDHFTPVSIKTHVRGPVPFLIFDSTTKIKQDLAFDEGIIKLNDESLIRIDKGTDLMRLFIFDKMQI